MDKVFGSLKGLLKIQHVEIDNSIFRLHYKVTVCILLAFSLLVTSKQYIGDPINCISKDDIPEKVLETYCWVHTTFSVKDAWEKEVGEKIPYPGVDTYSTGDQKVHHAYYQWVCFVLFYQAIMFYMPRYFWKCMESGRIRSLVSDLNSPIIADDEKKSSTASLVNYFVANFHRHDSFFFYYLVSEGMNVANVIGQMYLIDTFLGGEFSSFGSEVLKFTEWDFSLRYDPMIRVFPRLAKCTFHRYGSSGDVQKHDAMCILPLNIVNEKIYIFLWFWFISLAVLSCCTFAYRLLIFVSAEARTLSMSSKARFVSGRSFDALLKKCKVGDIFILGLLHKNMHLLHFKDFVEELSDRLEDTKEFRDV